MEAKILIRGVRYSFEKDLNRLLEEGWRIHTTGTNERGEIKEVLLLRTAQAR